MTKNLFLFLFFCSSFFCFGQIKGKVIANNSGIPLANVEITNLELKDTYFTNSNGLFLLKKPGFYAFKKVGYSEKIIELNENIEYIIQLSINPFELNEITISTNQIPRVLKKATASVSMITSNDIQLANNTDFAPILNRAPGVFMQSGSLNTNRITIRGIGSRNLFGTSKIRAYFKDIPLTNGSGETTLEDFELATISQMEITKGSASSIYGAGLGGVIRLIPQNGYLNETSSNTEFSVGSFGLVKGILNLAYGSKKHSINAVYSNTHSDGYRENNEYNRQTFTINSNHFLNAKNEVSILMSYVDLKAFIPSSINEDTYLNSPESAAFTWQQSKGYEDSKRGIIGLSWNHNYNDNLKQNTSIFTSFTNTYEPRPFNILKENTSAYGIRSRLLGTLKLYGKKLKWTFGGEFFKDTYTYGTFENLYEDYPEGTGSVEGNRLSDFHEQRNYYNIFAESDIALSEKTTLSIGLNLNETAYKLKDDYPVSDTNPDQSGQYKYKSIMSPKFGVSHLISNNLSLFSNISHGFSPLSLQETLLPDGQINTNLKPETGWNYELGTRGTLFSNRLQFNASIYHLNIKNLIVSRRTTQDQFIGINAGSTKHNGLEAAINYNWLSNNNVTLSSFFNYTLNQFKFKNFVDDSNNFSGNKLTGVPSEVINLGFNFISSIGFYGNINYQHVGSMPINDSNSLFSESYNLTHCKIGYKLFLNKKLKLNAFFGLNNIFDVHYASQILINATGFGGSAPRYYYPGNPINYYTGININYIF